MMLKLGRIAVVSTAALTLAAAAAIALRTS
jgi:hypothetical protein